MRFGAATRVALCVLRQCIEPGLTISSAAEI
jgi:hypothetical protein